MVRARVDQNAGKRIRVVGMIDSLERPGGGERLAVEGVVRLDPTRFERALCITRWDDGVAASEPARSILERLRAEGVEVIPVRRTSRAGVRAWGPLWRAHRRRPIDVLHGHLFGSNVWATVLGRLWGVPVVVAHEHMWSYGAGRARPLIDRTLIARFSDVFIAVSGYGRDEMVSKEGIDPAAIHVLTNGIEAPALLSKDAARVALGLPESGLVVGSIGHLRSEKAYEVLVDATALLTRRFPDVRAVIIGTGPEEEMLRATAERAGLGDRLVLAGQREDAASLISAFDVSVCCSDFEGGPLSVMEYMASGVPVVASDVGGLPELLEGGRAGRLVPSRDPAALAAAIEGLKDHPEATTEMVSRAAELRAREHDIATWVARLEALYARLLDEKVGGVGDRDVGGQAESSVGGDSA